MVTDMERYVPDSWICTACRGRFSEQRQVLIRHSLITYCPSCEHPMRRETYREALATLTEAAATIFHSREILARLLVEMLLAVSDPRSVRALDEVVRAVERTLTAHGFDIQALMKEVKCH